MTEMTVNITTPGDMKIEDCVIPADYSAEQVITEIIDELNLPRLSEDGQQISYSLLHQNQNATIPAGKTLTEAGVQSGDSIRLVSSHQVEPVVGDGNRFVDPEGNGRSPEGTIDVVLSLLDLNRSERVSLQHDLAVKDLIRQISANYDLPPRNELDNPNTYRMYSKALGRFLKLTETLRQAGIPRLDRINIDREEEAGA